MDALLSEDKLLYLGENKKETKKWFNALGRSTPFGGTKFGLIRSISGARENVNGKFQLKSVTELEQEVKELKKYAAYRKRGTSDREILASTAEGSAQTEWERKRLSEYKDVMSRLETYERRLAVNKAKLAKD